jgi:hypothetical protein
MLSNERTLKETCANNKMILDFHIRCLICKRKGIKHEHLRTAFLPKIQNIWPAPYTLRVYAIN